MEYCEVRITAAADAMQIIPAILDDMDFEGFVEEDDYLLAYIPADQFNRKKLDEALKPFKAEWIARKMEDRNWNKEWEQSFSPVALGNEVLIRAGFHAPRPGFRHEIVIQPQMAFGTGHHNTTWLMMSLMLSRDLQGKTVMDYGSGTGILAILAEKLGAAHVLAFDNDKQAVKNGHDNLELNNSKNIELKAGVIDNFKGQQFDVVLGNLTRNTILETLPAINYCCCKNGFFIASGFYTYDLTRIAETAEQNGFSLQEKARKDDWAAAVFVKN